MQITRARNILMQQDQEWSKFIAEELESQALIRYGFLFIILSNVAAVLSHSYYGFGWFNYYLAMQVVNCAIQVGCLYFLPSFFARLATSFGGQNNQLNALKLYVFSMTPGWVGSLFVLVPVAGGFVALAGGLFTIYLFWKHVGEAMSIPQEKQVQYVLACVALIILAIVVAGIIGSTLAGMMFKVPTFSNMGF